MIGTGMHTEAGALRSQWEWDTIVGLEVEVRMSEAIWTRIITKGSKQLLILGMTDLFEFIRGSRGFIVKWTLSYSKVPVSPSTIPSVPAFPLNVRNWINVDRELVPLSSWTRPS